MIRKFFIILFISFFTFSCSTECDCKKNDDRSFSEIWFPKIINSKKILNYYSETDTQIVEWTIIGDTIIDGQYGYIEENKFPDNTFFFYWFVNQDSAWMISSIDGERDRPFIFPFVQGEWQLPHNNRMRVNVEGDTIRTSRYLVPQDKTSITTANGCYDECWKILFYDVTDSIGNLDTILIAEDYYAKDVGFVYKIVDSNASWEIISCQNCSD